ncbi:TRAP transporter small permease [Azospirillum sp. RWY-5-1]|uniref:TRAP transporter small permease protein n=1 Tax=Azospirillum oleiclasticum TaxID=2735135 RepID=A0ABX2TFU4_9PROT|nr:TRAP transporter small permease [Azospirillum oleiclasticum]NYZ16036.1 TRAP transporter small permease [Azospirillum oleiclasticum]NYZ22917.1 TRAP transporter small permease [Azospirillum oleiclasticum]
MTRLLVRLADAVLALLLAAMVAMVFGNVVLRYVFNSGITVSEELSRFFFVWLTFIGAVVAMGDGSHLGMDSLVARLGRRGRMVCAAVSNALILLCCVLLFLGTLRQHEINATTMAPVTGIPMAWVFGVVYLTAAGIGVHAVLRLARIATGTIRDDELIEVREDEAPVLREDRP